ncbi:ABC transporter substrate-binding protein [Streptomyces sp. NPDC046821]|uniref:ABC transporter substrate-binding protein n=1 Tax=Streptomyces sp. NPDC046821 TaxID=3154702 RepID=UPI0033F9A4E0
MPKRNGALGGARTGRILAVAATASLVLTGCAGGQDGAANNSGALNIAYPQPLETLDPIHADQNQTNTIDDVLYDTLVTYDRSNKLVGSLAGSFALTPDASAVKVTLRSGVKFHDGSELTADDVKFSFDRYASIGQGIASDLADYKSTTVTDATHLTISLKQPDALFLGHLSKVYVLEKKLVSAHAGTNNGQSWLQSHDAGSGPYKVNQGTVPVSVDRFAGFWAYNDKRPKQIVFDQIAESATARDELRSGQLDLAIDLQAPDAKALEDSSGGGVSVKWLKVPNAAYIFFNTAQGPTANPDVRKALQLAFPHDDALSKIRRSEGVVENGPLPQTMPCQVTSPPFKQDLNKAKELLKSAGQPHPTLTLRFQPSFSEQVREATLFQSELRSIGVKLNLVPITFPDYLTSLSHPSTTPEMTLLQDTAPSPDTGIYLRKAYDSDNIGTTNRAAYKNPQVHSLLAKASTTTDASARCGIYRQVQTLINADAPAIDLYTLWSPMPVSSRVAGVEASQTVYPLSLRGVTLK